jgi:hypothetical protein
MKIGVAKRPSVAPYEARRIADLVVLEGATQLADYGCYLLRARTKLIWGASA